MNVLEEDDQGPLAGKRLEQPPRRPEDLLALDRTSATPIASSRPSAIARASWPSASDVIRTVA